MRRAIIVVIGLIMFLILAGCGRRDTGPICTEIGCTDSVTIDLEGNIPASYEIDVTVSGVEKGTIRCEVSMRVSPLSVVQMAVGP